MSMKKKLNEAESLQQEIDTWKFCIAGAALLALMWLAIWLAGFNGQRLSTEIEHWGQLGDFIGGLMNPLVAFAAFYWLTRSVQLQKKELEETRRALEESSAAQKQQAEQGRVAVRLDALVAAHAAASNDVARLEDQYARYQSQIDTGFITNSTYSSLSKKLDSLDPQLAAARATLLAHRSDMEEILKRYPLPAPVKTDLV